MMLRMAAAMVVMAAAAMAAAAAAANRLRAFSKFYGRVAVVAMNTALVRMRAEANS